MYCVGMVPSSSSFCPHVDLGMATSFSNGLFTLMTHLKEFRFHQLDPKHVDSVRGTLCSASYDLIWHCE